jgi:hypothetical protein
MHGDVCFPRLNNEEELKLQEANYGWCHGTPNERLRLSSSLGKTYFITFRNIKLSFRLGDIRVCCEVMKQGVLELCLQTLPIWGIRLSSYITLLLLLSCLTSWLSHACLMHVPATSANGYSLQDNNGIGRQDPCNIISSVNMRSCVRIERYETGKSDARCHCIRCLKLNFVFGGLSTTISLTYLVYMSCRFCPLCQKGKIRSMRFLAVLWRPPLPQMRLMRRQVTCSVGDIPLCIVWK